MRPLGTFTQPMETTLALHTDGPPGLDFTASLGEKDGRPAWVIELPDDLPDGHGADLTITFADGTVCAYHGFLRLKVGEPWAEFLPDVYRKPERPFR